MPVKVAIVVVTYNHEKYIEKTIQSILDQKVSFSLQIVIADDGSQDRTVEIINSFHQQYPEKITILKHQKNKGVLKNVLRVIPEIKSDYCAILDGDDYWENHYKLQQQVDFLEKDHTYNGVFHDARIIHIGTTEKILFNQKKYYSQSYQYYETISPQDLLDRSIILPSSSALLRTKAFKHVDLKLLTDNYSILWKITCLLIKNSRFYFINEPWSVYHNHYNGISKSNNHQFHFSHISFLEKLLNDSYYSFYTYEIYRAMANEYRILLESKEPMKKSTRNQVFRNYIGCELRKLWYYRKRIKNQ